MHDYQQLMYYIKVSENKLPAQLLPTGVRCNLFDHINRWDLNIKTFICYHKAQQIKS